jgi:hypothetical protein
MTPYALLFCVLQVTTKKGYDGCRKADYLCAHDPITDKTFANLGETTISNLKSNFDGVETGEQQKAQMPGFCENRGFVCRKPHCCASADVHMCIGRHVVRPVEQAVMTQQGCGQLHLSSSSTSI